MLVAASSCTQVHCQASVCAANDADAQNAASFGLQAIMGGDCGNWTSGPTNTGQGQCASGLSVYTGEFVIWRAWTADPNYSGTFQAWANFLGASCTGAQSVNCDPKTGTYPNSINGQCTL
jgi:hypothetical protein